MAQKNVKIYCRANCKYNRGRCNHPTKQDMAPYGGIDRYYVEKCALFQTDEKGSAE